MRGNKGQAGSATNRKGKAAKDEGLGDQKAIGIDILAPERREAAKARKNRQKPAAEAASQQAVCLSALFPFVDARQDAADSEYEAVADAFEAFTARWRAETAFWGELRSIIKDVEADDA